MGASVSKPHLAIENHYRKWSRVDALCLSQLSAVAMPLLLRGLQAVTLPMEDQVRPLSSRKYSYIQQRRYSYIIRS